MMSRYRELKAKAEELLKQAEQARIEERGEVIKQIKTLLEPFDDITAYDLGLVPVKQLKPGKGGERTFPAKKAKPTLRSPKYRNPATGETWGGFGGVPKWMRGVENRDDYLVKTGEHQ